MALKKQVVPIVLAEGIAQKTDSKVLSVGKLTKLQNGVRKKAGRISKRYGTSNLPRAIATGGALSSSNGVATFGNELLQFSVGKAFSYAPSSSLWYDKGNVPIISSDISQVFRNDHQQTSANLVYSEGTVVSAWEDSRGGVRFKAYDFNSSAILIEDTSLNATAVRPKTLAIGAFFYVFYVDGANLLVRKYDKSMGTTIGAPVSLAGDVNASGYYDATVIGSNLSIAWHTTGNQIKVGYVTPAPALGSPVFGLPSPVTIAEPVTDCLTLWHNTDSQQIYISWFDSALGLRVTALAAVNLLQSFAPTTLDATVAPIVRNVTGIGTSSSSNTVLYEVTAANTSNTLVRTTTISNLGVIGIPAIVRRSAGLVSKAFSYEGMIFAHMSFTTTLQASYFLVRSDGLTYARTLYQNAGGQSNRQSFLVETSFSSSGIVQIVGLIKNKISTQNNVTFTRTGVAVIEYNLSSDVQPQTVALGENLCLFSALPQAYDGVSFTELGFNQFPEVMSSSSASVGGSMSDGNYQYVATYEWTDAKGQVHRSATSLPLDVVLSGGTATQLVTLTLPTLRMTAKEGTRVQPLIVVYRTTNNGQIFYRVSSPISVLANNGILFSDSSVDTVTFTDAYADSSIQANETVYTTGGILDNFPPVPCTVAVVYRNRIVTNSTDNSGLTYYSKIQNTGEGIAFTPLFALAADPEGLPTRAFGVLDDKLLIAKDNTWYVTAGSGPNDAGQFDDFAQPERMAVSVGCPYPNSVVTTQEGLIFKSNRGFYFLDRGLNEDFIGADIEDFNSLTVTAAVQMPVDTEVRFLNSDGECLVYNYLFRQWATFTNYAAKDALLWQGNFVFVTSEAIIRQEDSSTFSDNGSYYSMLVELGWLSFAGIQGFQRIWRLLILGDYVSAHQLRIRVAKNFEPTWIETVYWNPVNAVGTTTYGEESPYGFGPYGGTLDSVYQARMHLATQKCESIRFEITDVQSSSIVGESMSLDVLSLEVGLKGSAFKASRSKGAGSLG